MLIKSIFLLFLIGILNNQINCSYYGYQTDKQSSDTERKLLELLTNDLLKSDLDEKVSLNLFLNRKM